MGQWLSLSMSLSTFIKTIGGEMHEAHRPARAYACAIRVPPQRRIKLRIPIKPSLCLGRDTILGEGDAPLFESVPGVRMSPLVELERGLRGFHRLEARRDGARGVEDAEDDGD
jgi:hypothetical protein